MTPQPLNQEAYKLLLKLIPRIEMLSAGSGQKSISEPYMDLSLDYLGHKEGKLHIALAHNYLLNGDLVADPDMEIIVDVVNKTAEPLSFQNIFGYERVDHADNSEHMLKLKESLREFLVLWLKNCLAQRHHFK